MINNPNIRNYHTVIDMTRHLPAGVLHTGAYFHSSDVDSRFISATLKRNGVPINLEGYTVTAKLKNESGSRTISNITTDITESNTGDILLFIPDTTAGKYTIAVSLELGDKVTVSIPYLFEVYPEFKNYTKPEGGSNNEGDN